MAKCEIANFLIAEVYNWALEKDYVTITERSVRLKPYFEWELIDLDNKNCQLSYDNEKLVVEPEKENYPVVSISWFGAVAFCNFLSEKEGKAPCYDLETWDFYFDNDGYRLPQADEWEYAARGGLNSKNYTYSGSDNPEHVAWYEHNSFGTVHSVGYKLPNELGIYDMSGNVREFCTEKVGIVGVSKVKDSDEIEIMMTGGIRMYRGGSFNTTNVEVSSFVSNFNYPDYCIGFDDVGFRVVSTVK